MCLIFTTTHFPYNSFEDAQDTNIHIQLTVSFWTLAHAKQCRSRSESSLRSCLTTDQGLHIINCLDILVTFVILHKFFPDVFQTFRIFAVEKTAQTQITVFQINASSPYRLDWGQSTYRLTAARAKVGVYFPYISCSVIFLVRNTMMPQ